MATTSIGGDLKISGNLINQAIDLAIIDTNSVYINDGYIFAAGGVANYRDGISLNNCIGDYCHFNLEFFGDTDSNIFWSLGFPIDTLLVNKSGCAKLTATNPIYVSGAAKIKSGQLVLNPSPSIPYKFVCNGNLEIMAGGGIFMGKDSTGAVANMAVAGSLYDRNLVVDATCTGLSNPYNGQLTLYSNTENMGNRMIHIASNSCIGDLHLISRSGSGFIFGKDITVNNLEINNVVQ
jgi:hypothetical protein